MNLDLYNLPFDQYSRYKTVADFVILNKDKIKKILDIGGGRDNLLKKFLPEFDVTVIDNYDEAQENYIQGSALALPFEENSFDLVFSCDVFEHIEPQDRQKFIKEQQRVAKKCVIVAAPFDNKLTAIAENNVNGFYKSLMEKDYIWLKEHIENGLPKQKELEDLLKQNNLNYKKTGHSNIFIWEKLIKYNILRGECVGFFEQEKSDSENLNKYYNKNLFTKDFNVLPYRYFYFINLGNEDFNYKDYLSIKADLVNNMLENFVVFSEKVLNNLIKKRVLFDKEQLKNKILLNEKQIEAQETQIKEKETQINDLLNSTSWKITKILRWSGNQLKKLKFKVKILTVKAKLFCRFWLEIKKSYKKTGLKKTFKKIIQKLSQLIVQKHRNKQIDLTLLSNLDFQKLVELPQMAGMALEDYFRFKKWEEKNFLTDEKIKVMAKTMDNWAVKPKISIIFPVYNTPEIYLRQAINSVVEQIYPNWELCMVNDASPDKIVKIILDEYAKRDSRIKVKQANENAGIVGASNQAYEMATGQFIALLDHDDLLTKHALWKNVEMINKYPDVDFIYSDHDKCTEGGETFAPEFKPDWSPELILSYGYTGHFRVFSKKIIEQVGFFRKKYEACQDYDLILRITEKTNKIQHIDDILYHWRAVQGSTALDVGFKPEQQTNGQLALQDHLARRELKVNVEIPEFAKKNRLSLYNLIFPNIYQEKITIVIPTLDKVDLLKTCVESIYRKTKYKNFEIIIIDTGSKQSETLKYFKQNNDKFKVVEILRDKFSYAFVHNQIMKQINSEFVVFLNNDTEVISEGWLTQMRGIFSLSDDIGAVGAKLLYKNKTIQHAGVVLDLFDNPNHIFKNVADGQLGYMFFPNVIRNYSACTAACLMFRKKDYEKVGGFDENLALAYNDIDLCLKLRKSGKRIVYNPNVKLFHYEMATRTLGEYTGESKYLHKKWGQLLQNDSYYNKNLSKKSFICQVKETYE